MPILFLGLIAAAAIAISRNKKAKSSEDSIYIPLSAETAPGNMFSSSGAIGPRPTSSPIAGARIAVPFGILTSTPPFATNVVLAEVQMIDSVTGRVTRILAPVGVTYGPAVGTTVRIDPYNVASLLT